MKKHLLSKIFTFAFLIVVCFVFTTPRAKAAQSDNDFLTGLTSTLHLEAAKEPGKTEEPGITGDEKIYSKVLSSTHKIQVSLNENLKLFFNLQPTIREYYEKLNTDKNCTMLGIDIFF